jgi:hypothetical protein
MLMNTGNPAIANQPAATTPTPIAPSVLATGTAVPVQQPAATVSTPTQTPLIAPVASGAVLAKQPVTQTYGSITYSMDPSGVITTTSPQYGTTVYNPSDTLYNAVNAAFGHMNYADYTAAHPATPIAPTAVATSPISGPIASPIASPISGPMMLPAASGAIAVK